jgi:hypothetical protein
MFSQEGKTDVSLTDVSLLSHLSSIERNRVPSLYIPVGIVLASSEDITHMGMTHDS